MSSEQSKPNLDAMLQMLQTTQEETLQLWDRFLKPPQVPPQALEVEVGTTPHDIVYEGRDTETTAIPQRSTDKMGRAGLDLLRPCQPPPTSSTCKTTAVLCGDCWSAALTCS